MSAAPQRHLRIVEPDTQLRDTQIGAETADRPRVWLMLGERQGDNAQVLALGRALTADLGWPHEIKQIKYDPNCEVSFRDRGATLIGVDLGHSSPLTPPWPDVLIAIGRRAAPISRWLKEQTQGRLLNVHLGRPRIAYHHFDLIFTTPQYGLPAAPNVTKLTLPITLHDETTLAMEAQKWEPRLRSLPRPWTALFIGGPTTQLRFDRDVGADLLARVSAHVGDRGSLLVTTSPRTSMDVADLFETGIKRPHYMHRWSRNAPNPYQAFLKLADSFIVTDDSVSMVAEAIDLMRPLYLFEVPRREKQPHMGLLRTVRHYFRSRRENRLIAGLRPDLTDSVYDALTRVGHARPRRSIDVFNRELYQAGLARPLDAPSETPQVEQWAQRRVPKEERDMVVAKIRDCFAARNAAESAQ
jgi:mitochondrial fission protein ELM1